jgi:hypothetical protein
VSQASTPGTPVVFATCFGVCCRVACPAGAAGMIWLPARWVAVPLPVPFVDGVLFEPDEQAARVVAAMAALAAAAKRSRAVRLGRMRDPRRGAMGAS